MNKENMVDIHKRALVININEIISLAVQWMELEIIMLSEISQIKKYKSTAHLLSYAESRF
jgi:hypothetical protein